MAILSHVFDPESIALIGASDREGSVGRIILTNLLNAKDSKIFPVNPRKKTLLAHECFPDIRSIPEHVDLAVIATPAKGVPALVEECGKAGVDGAVIIPPASRKQAPGDSFWSSRYPRSASDMVCESLDRIAWVSSGRTPG